MSAIYVIRPPKACRATAALAAQMDVPVEAYPMFAIAPREWSGPHPDWPDALLIGSANAIEQAGDALAQYAHLPVHAVGQTTADRAREAGFALASIGQGGLQQILDALPAGKHKLLRLAGEKHVPLNRPDGVTIELRVVYAAQPQPMPDALAEKLGEGGLVLLHSAEAAKLFAAECERLAIDKSRIALAALGPRIVEAAGSGWAQARSAPQSRDTALLALARDMWQDQRSA